MHRRALVSALGLAAASLAGCLDESPQATGPRNPPGGGTPPPTVGDGGGGESGSRDTFDVETFDFEADDDGSLRVFGTVANDGDADGDAAVEVVVRTGEDEFTQTTTVSVPGGGTAEFAVNVDVSFERFNRSGQVSVNARPA
jgi:hypothetical protein